MKKHRKRWLAGGGIAVVAVVAYLTTAWAIAAPKDDGGIPSNLPVAALPVAQLDAATVTQMESLKMGVSSAAVSQARLVGATSLGSLYALPDSKGGVCLFLDDTIACGNPNTNAKKLVALFADDSSGNLIGGVITAPGVQSVTVGDGVKTAHATPVPGGYIVDASAGLSALRHKLTLATG